MSANWVEMIDTGSSRGRKDRKGSGVFKPSRCGRQPLKHASPARLRERTMNASRSLGGISFHSVNPDDLTNEVTTVPSPGDGRAANLAPDRGIMTMTVGGSPIKGGKDPMPNASPPPPPPSCRPWTKEVLSNSPQKRRRHMGILCPECLTGRQPQYRSREGITLPRNRPDTAIE